MSRKIDISAVPAETDCNYPAPFDGPCSDQASRRLGRHAGLTRIGVNLTVVAPGAWTSQRHWHSHEDEFVWVLEGELVLVTADGEEVLRAGDCAAFRLGDPDGHHLINRSDRPATVLEIGNSHPADRCVYPDIDMIAEPGVEAYSHRDGSLYPPKS